MNGILVHNGTSPILGSLLWWLSHSDVKICTCNLFLEEVALYMLVVRRSGT
jgi:hypothetical protein